MTVGAVLAGLATLLLGVTQDVGLFVVSRAHALTAERVVRRTPLFIAPEQVLGGRPVDHRADIYGTGCVTYWLLTESSATPLRHAVS